MKKIEEKYRVLKEYIKSLDSVAVAFSSGVDSTLLLAIAQDVLGEKAVAITAKSSSFPKWEQDEAAEFVKERGIRQIVVETKELELEGFQNNQPDRCYLCKYEIFSNLRRIAAENGLKEVIDGSNLDDLSDYRPGKRAIEELGIKSPLQYAELRKEEIRQLSFHLGLPTWEKPSYACLASRFPYGEKITREKMKRVEEAELFLMKQGFRQVRVRHHGDLARIEVLSEQIPQFLAGSLRSDIYKRLNEIGFTYVSLDLDGYRSGSMNETL